MGKKKPQHHPSTQHIQQVAKGAIAPELSKQLNQQVQEMYKRLQGNLNAQLAGIDLRQSTLEELACDKWKISKDKWAKLLVDKEDSSLGYKESKKPAAKGDLVRGSFSFKADPKGNFSPEQPISFPSLAKEYRLTPEVENAIVGMKKGQSKTISADMSAQKTTEEKLRDGEKAKKLIEFKVTVNRISVKQQPKKEASDAQQN